MAKSKLIAALDAHKGKNYKLIKQKKQQKEAARKKKAKALNDGGEKETVETEANGTSTLPETESEGWESDGSEAADGATVSRATTGIDGFVVIMAYSLTSWA